MVAGRADALTGLFGDPFVNRYGEEPLANSFTEQKDAEAFAGLTRIST